MKLSNNTKGDISIGIPNQDQFDSVDVLDDKIVYSGQNSKADIIVESVEGGVRQAINIKSNDAPDFYDFPLEIANNDKIELVENGQATISNSKGEVKVIIVKPWAKDANNKELKTWYSIANGNALRQYIDFKGASFPIVSDPLWCSDVVNDVKWVYRNIYNNAYNWSLEAAPTWCGKLNSGPTPWGSWQEVVDKTPNSSQWDKKYGTSTYLVDVQSIYLPL